MRNSGYNHNHQQQHHHHHHHLQQQHKGTFLPTLCSRPSMMKDVHAPTNNPFNKAHSSSARRSVDPTLSPKVGCMGQVKKKNIQHQNNYKLGMVFPTSTTSSTTNSTTAASNPNSTAVGFGHTSSNFSYSKFLRLFSSKTILTSPPVHSAAATKCSTTTTTTVSCRKSRPHHHHQQNRLRSRSCEDGVISGFGSPINVADLDPPLPVIIKIKATTSSSPNCDDNNKNSSLWKRRSGGAALKGLQIQQVHIPIPIKPTVSV